MVPGEPNAFVLSENKPHKLPGYAYYGSGRSNGQCGITIRHVNARHNGIVQCFMGGEGDEIAHSVSLNVARKSPSPILPPTLTNLTETFSIGSCSAAAETRDRRRQIHQRRTACQNRHRLRNRR